MLLQQQKFRFLPPYSDDASSRSRFAVLDGCAEALDEPCLLETVLSSSDSPVHRSAFRVKPRSEMTISDASRT